jgi:hypothetical protein
MAEGLPYGTFAAQSSSELLDWIERTFVAPAPSEQRDAVRAEALAELTAAELELIAGDQVVSRSGGREWVRVSLPEGTTAGPSFTFEKAPGVSVQIRRHGPDVLVAIQAGKPAIEFRRLRSG